jgi:hypothetical protein
LIARVGHRFPPPRPAVRSAARFAFTAGSTFGGVGGTWPIQRLIDDAEYAGGTVTVFLEVHGKTDDATKPLIARLYDVTGANVVGGSEAQTASLTEARARSGAFSFDAGENTYGIQFGGSDGATHTLYDVVLRVVSA